MTEPRTASPLRIRPRSPAVIGLSDRAFYVVMAVIGGSYAVLILLLLAADVAYMVRETGAAAGSVDAANPILRALAKPEIRHSIALSLVSCTLSAILSLLVAVPISYLLARFEFPG